ncbi:MAG: AMP-binding protein, partial [Pseudomonadota bacterium]
MTVQTLNARDQISVLNGPEIALPDTSIIAQIATQMRDAPDRAALAHGDIEMSYGDLWRAASAVAGQLSAQGVGPGALTPVLCRGGVALPVAAIGVMLAGAAFVPLDAAWPVERIRVALGKLAPKVVLYEDGLPEALLKATGETCLPINLDGLSTVEPLDAAPDDLCYGFFTSGSTGVPKCCLNTHRGILNRFT